MGTGNPTDIIFALYTGVFLNLGTNRRYDKGFDAARELIESGDLGELKTIIVHSTSSLFNGVFSDTLFPNTQQNKIHHRLDSITTMC